MTIFAEPWETLRFPAIKNVDLRASKFFNFDRHRVEFIFDVFNLFKPNVVTNYNVDGIVLMLMLSDSPRQEARIGTRMNRRRRRC